MIMIEHIEPGDRVTITTAQGSLERGRAVMKGPAGWVLNLGGRHGRPGIATDRNIIEVRKAPAGTKRPRISWRDK